MKIKTSLLSIALLFSYFNLSAQSVNEVSEPNSDMNPALSIMTNTASSENHQTLLAGMRAADLEDILSYAGPFTVFAPSDSAFEKLTGNVIADLFLPDNKQELQALMTYHIIAGNFSASKILKAMCRGNGKATFTTVQGDELTATMDGVDIILTDQTGNSAKIIVADANQSNGVIHQIDTVISPGQL